MKTISISKLGAGSGTAKAIERGRSFTVTHKGAPVALYRAYQETDQGEEVSAADFYNSVGTCVERVRKGKMLVVLRRGTAFATLCKPEERKTRKRARAKRRPKAAKPPPPPPPAAPVKPQTVQGDESEAEAKPEEAPKEASGQPSSPRPLQDAVRILEAADMLPEGKTLELLELGERLDMRGELDMAMRLLKALIAEK